MASLGFKEGWNIAWATFKELLAMAKQSALALYATVMTVIAGTAFVLGLLIGYIWWKEVKQAQKDGKASGELHIKDMEAMLGWADSAKICQYKLNAAMETHPPIIIHDTVYITKKQ